MVNAEKQQMRAKENNFTTNQNLQAREKTQKSSERLPKDIIKDIRKELPENDTCEVMDFRKFWESRYERELSEFELQECRDNVAAFFNLLAEWDEDYE